MKLRAYLADDEPLALKRLSRLLADTGRFELAGSATDPETAVAFLSRERVDVLFLDIEIMFRTLGVVIRREGTNGTRVEAHPAPIYVRLRPRKHQAIEATHAA